jgi:hypothetical protein
VTGNVTQQLEDMPKLAEMPIVAGDMIYLVTTDGDVVAFR